MGGISLGWTLAMGHPWVASPWGGQEAWGTHGWHLLGVDRRHGAPMGGISLGLALVEGRLVEDARGLGVFLTSPMGCP